MLVAAATSGQVLIEFGAVLLGVAVLGRLAARAGLPSIPLYVLAGLLVGEGGLASLDATEGFIAVGSDLGVVLLLLLLGLEYSTAELHHGLRTNWQAGVVDLALNVPPGFLAGLLLGWGPLAALVLGGVTYISSSGIIAKLLDDLGRIGNRETAVVLSVLVMEDLAMAVYLPILGVLIAGGQPLEGAFSVAVALGVVAIALVVSARFGTHISALVATRSAELLILTVLGLTFLVAGLAEEVQVSAAVGAFLLGVTLSGQVAEEGRQLLLPVRDVFGGLFFLFFGIQIDPSTLLPTILPALALVVVSSSTKLTSGWWSARRGGIGRRGRIRAAISLVPRGEFSIVIAGLGVRAGLDEDLGPFAASYVLVLAVVGSVAIRFADVIAHWTDGRDGRGRRLKPVKPVSAR